MLTEISVFVIIFTALMLRMENKREWLYNIRHNKMNNWRKTWHRIPTTKLAFVGFVLLFLTAVVSSFYSFELNYLVWDFWFILHFALFIVAGASLYFFVWSLGGRAMRSGQEVGKLSAVEGTEPSGKKTVEGESFMDGMFESVFDVAFGKSERRKKKKRR